MRGIIFPKEFSNKSYYDIKVLALVAANNDGTSFDV